MTNIVTVLAGATTGGLLALAWGCKNLLLVGISSFIGGLIAVVAILNDKKVGK